MTYNFNSLMGEGDPNGQYFEGLATELAKRKDFLTKPLRHVGHTFHDRLARCGGCHTNVQNWIDANGGSRIYGWLFDDSEVASSGRLMFHAHSLVLTVDDEVLDVTLSDDQKPLPFLEAHVLESQFDWIAEHIPTLLTTVDAKLLGEFNRATENQMGESR